MALANQLEKDIFARRELAVGVQRIIVEEGIEMVKQQDGLHLRVAGSGPGKRFEISTTTMVGDPVPDQDWKVIFISPALEAAPVPTPTPTPTPTVPVMAMIAVINQSTTDSDQKVQSWIDAVRKQCDTDVAKLWDTTVNFTLIPKDQTPPQADWYCLVADDSDVAGALGYHDSGPNGEPIMKIFTKTTESIGQSPSITLSHEVIESIGDPGAEMVVSGVDANGRACFYYRELCDPVESDTYKIDGIDVSDFVTRDWFKETPATGQFDALNLTTGPFHLHAGGYMELSYDGSNWTQVDMQSVRSALHGKPGSRHRLYKTALKDRKKSTFKIDKKKDIRV